MLHIDPIIYPFLALFLMTIPVQWLCAAFAAAFIHEMAHISAIFLLGGNIQKISISIGCTKIHARIPTPWKEILCALAGPAGSFLTLCFIQTFPGVTLCAFAQGLFNLIPIYPLDGGRVLYCLLQIFVPEKADTLSRMISKTVLYFFLILSLWGLLFLSAGPIPLMIFLLFFHKRKKTCKDT